MIGIRAIASHIPDAQIDNLEQGAVFGEDEDFIRGKIGAVSLPLKDDHHEASDLGKAAVEALISKTSLERSDIDALIVVTQNPDVSGLPHTAAILQDKLELTTGVAAFDVSLGCSGYVYGLSVLRGLMTEAGLKNGVLVTSDPYSRVIDRSDRVTSLLFGDAATATWLGEGGAWTFGKPMMATDGSGAAALHVKDGTLHMHGRDVFSFAAQRVPEQIEEFLETRNLKAEDIDLFCLHQGSAAIIDAIARRFAHVKDRFPKEITHTGNTVSSSIPLLLEPRISNGSEKRILISGFGVGLSWATNLLEKVATND